MKRTTVQSFIADVRHVGNSTWLQDPFWNSHEYRPRVVARLVFAAFPITVALAVAGLIAYAITVVRGVLSLRVDQSIILAMVSTVGEQVLGSLAFTVGIIGSAWLLDRRRISDLGVRLNRTWVADFSFGLLLGLGLKTGILLVGTAAGWISVTGVLTGAAGRALGPWLIAVFMFHLGTGVQEEVLFRGFLVTNLAEAVTGIEYVDQSLAGWIAVGSSSLAFSLWHLGRPASFLLLAGLLGVGFGTAYVLTGSIAIPIGVHTAWNMAETTLYSSQNRSTGTLVEVVEEGPRLAGITAVEGLDFIAVGVGMLAILAWVRFRDGDLRVHPGVSLPNLHNRRFWGVFQSLFSRGRV